jgi:hypothetical protein
MILGIQILGILFALIMIYITFLHQRRNEFTIKESIFWFGAWIAFFILVIFPNVLDPILRDVLQIARTLDFFIVLGFIFLLGIVFHTYTIMRKTQNRVESLVRKIAIKNNKKDD